MIDDLIERLRKEDEWTNQRPYFHAHAKSLEAADRIEAQAAEIERLREALRDAAEVIENCNVVFLHKWGTTNKWRNAVLAKARAALAGKAGQ